MGQNGAAMCVRLPKEMPAGGHAFTGAFPLGGGAAALPGFAARLAGGGLATAAAPGAGALPGFDAPLAGGGLATGAPAGLATVAGGGVAGVAGETVLFASLPTQLPTKYCARAGLNQGTEWPASSRVAKVKPPWYSWANPMTCGNGREWQGGGKGRSAALARQVVRPPEDGEAPNPAVTGNDGRGH